MSHAEINFIFTAAIFFTVGLTVGAMFMFFKMINRFAQEEFQKLEDNNQPEKRFVDGIVLDNYCSPNRPQEE